ncbi:site-specific DNA-methyltransferase [Pseudaminobacter arsenicus]|uniref:Methyltransferase n=1 Tax=Borborobacter arsenicus TaxID=1851146 RepID=A0A432UZQ1_9HYPH|nr:site-specific DNA-methyltransferase [Pseudaminobacter arsenicus]RUM95272.1 site-specific DNA-methyltransferase [Pseudaminobacter arsenicus]
MTIQFAPDAIEQWPIERLKPYAKNAKTHAPDQVARIAASMAEFGWTVPVLVSAEGEVIAGHGRILAAGELGLPEVPVIILDHLSEAQRRAYRIADNKLTELGGWDDELLAQELHALNGDGFDLSLTGLDEAELDRLMGELADDPGGHDGEDDIPEPPVDPVTRRGDLWVLGRHRLLCGDATVATDVERLLGSVVPHLMVTDPPYGVDYDPQWRNEAGVSTTARTGRVANDDRADWRAAWALFPGDVAYVWHAGVHAATVADSLEACGFAIRSQIIWAKPRLVLSRGHYHWQHEPCWYAVREGATGHWQGARDQTTIWAIGTGDDAEDDATVHGTQKPVECMRRPLLNNSGTGASVYEPFSGSGSTLIAAETTGRACFAMELDPRYCDVAVERWQTFTGEEAVRHPT